MLLSYTIVDFHLFYDGTVDIQIWAPLTRSQYKISNTQVNVIKCFYKICLLLQLIYFLLFLDYAVVKGDASVSEIKFSMRTKISALVSFENRKAGRPTVDPED